MNNGFYYFYFCFMSVKRKSSGRIIFYFVHECSQGDGNRKRRDFTFPIGPFIVFLACFAAAEDKWQQTDITPPHFE